jgi:hypothetical protein
LREHLLKTAVLVNESSRFGEADEDGGELEAATRFLFKNVTDRFEGDEGSISRFLYISFDFVNLAVGNCVEHAD